MIFFSNQFTNNIILRDINIKQNEVSMTGVGDRLQVGSII